MYLEWDENRLKKRGKTLMGRIRDWERERKRGRERERVRVCLCASSRLFLHFPTVKWMVVVVVYAACSGAALCLLLLKWFFMGADVSDIKCNGF